MKTVKIGLKSISPYSQSRIVAVEALPSESKDDYERRNWRHRIHADSEGGVYIPPMCFKKTLDSAAKYSALQIPGKGKATYTKCVESGVLIFDPLPLNVDRDQVEGEWLFLDANGKKGKQSSGRVQRCMPKIDHWEGELTVRVIDETVLNMHPVRKSITVLQFFFEQAGALIGVGRFRPENGGFYGRFLVTSFRVVEESDEAAA